MADQRIKIPRATDRTIAETFKELAIQYNINNIHVTAFAFSTLGQVNVTEEPSGDWSDLLSHDSCLINTVDLVIGGLRIRYSRGGEVPPPQQSHLFDEIVLYWDNNPIPTVSQKLDIIAKINANLNAFNYDYNIRSIVSEEQTQLLAIHNTTLSRLESLNEDLIRKNSEFRSKLEAQFDDSKRRVEQEYIEKKQQIESEGKIIAAQIAEKERELEARLKIIDDRDNTHVRRAIRDKMLDDVKQRIDNFGVSGATASKRDPVGKGIKLLIGTILILLLWTALEILLLDGKYTFVDLLRISSIVKSPVINNALANSNTNTELTGGNAHIYWLWTRFTIYSLALIGTILYYIRWMNRWAEQHICSEFQLQQFYVDINRANWVIESCLEWRKSTDTEIPTALLDSITRGLFVNNQSEPERVMHPADELASALIGTASKLRLKAGDNEIDFDKPGKIPNKPIKVGSIKTES